MTAKPIPPVISLTPESSRKRRIKQPTQRDPRGIPIMIMRGSGKKRMGWKKR